MSRLKVLSLSLGIFFAVGLLLWLGRSESALSSLWDEQQMQGVVDSIIQHRWSIGSLLDYQDTKGPAFFWLYAAAANLLDPDLSSLRLTSLVCFVLTSVPVALIARRCGGSEWRPAAALLLYILLPYNTATAALFMSEPSFLLGSTMLWAVFLGSISPASPRIPRAAGPLMFGIILAILLHHRIHGIVFACSVCLVAFHRDRWRSWPWWLACALAGLSRVPLWIRWGGLVTTDFQDRYSLGLHVNNLTYVAMALLPALAIFIPVALLDRSCRAKWCGRLLILGALAGAFLGIFFPPNLSLQLDQGRYLGATATMLRLLPDSTVLLPLVVVLLASLAGLAFSAFTLIVWRRSQSEPAAVLMQCAWCTVTVGWLLYGLTRGDVYDRYMLGLIVLMPFVWARVLSRRLVVVQGAALLVLAAILMSRWLW